MSRTTKKLAEAFLRYQKETARANPHSRYIGPVSDAYKPAALAPGANEVLPPPVADHDRALAGQQIDDVVTMMQPVMERFSGEKELIAALKDLVAKLRMLVAQGEVKKQAQAPMPFRKRFIRVVDPEVRATIVDANSLDGMVLDATRRARKGEEYH